MKECHGLVVYLIELLDSRKKKCVARLGGMIVAEKWEMGMVFIVIIDYISVWKEQRKLHSACVLRWTYSCSFPRVGVGMEQTLKY